MQDPWSAAKRATASLSIAVPALTTKQVWAVFAVVVLLVLAVCWLARYTDAEEITTPFLKWRRKAPEDQEPP